MSKTPVPGQQDKQSRQERPAFKTSPLPQAGDSGRERLLNRLCSEFPWLVAGFVFVGFVLGVNIGLQMSRLFNVRVGTVASLAIFAATIGLMVTTYVLLKRMVDRSIAQSDRESLGIKGERVVADSLNELERMTGAAGGFRVFHDVPPEPGGKANFDHVVIGPTGVFVIETKARTKKEGGDNKVVVTADGRVLVNGMEQERCPIKQAKALRAAMKTMLEQQTTLRDVHVQAVVIYPEWWVDMDAYRNAGGDIWVMTSKRFLSWATNGRDPVRLSQDDIERLARRIEDHSRAAS